MDKRIIEVQNAYDTIASSYDITRYKKKASQYQDYLERNFIRNHVKPGCRVLEIGSGTGRITNVLLDISDSVTAVDISAKMLAILESKVGKKKNLQLIHSNLFELREQLGSSKFDVIVSLRALPHLDNIEGALAIFRDLLNKGGQAVFDLWNYQSILYIVRKILNRKHKIPTYHLSYKEMVKYINDAGFTIINKMPLWIYPRIGNISLDNISNILPSVYTYYAYSIIFNTQKR